MVKAIQSKFATLAFAAIAGSSGLLLTGCVSTAPQDQEGSKAAHRFIEDTPEEVTNAFVSDGKIWLTLSKKAGDLVSVGDGVKNIPFEKIGNFYVVPDVFQRIYLQFGNGNVEMLITKPSFEKI